MTSELFNFSLVFSLAVFGGVLLKRLRLPSLLAYVLLGLFLSYRFGSDGFGGYFSFVGSLGVMLLLFLVGLEMNLKELGTTGAKNFLLSVFQLILTSVCFLAILNDFTWSGGFLAAGLALSSTILVSKVLTERREGGSIHGRLSLSLLLFQDLFAVGLMVVLANQNLSLREVVIRAVILALFVLIVGRTFWQKIINKLTKDREDGLLLSLGWCFLIAAVASSKYVGLSMEIGGFLAGLSLSGSLGSGQISAKIRPMKDFFITVFFISLGARVSLFDINWLLVLYLSTAVVLVKPLLVWFILRVFRYSQRTSIISGLFLGQISEFALVLAVVGERTKLLTAQQSGQVAAVGLISLTVSSIVLMRLDSVYKFIKKVLDKIWLDKFRLEKEATKLTNHVILVGCNRLGLGILHNLDELSSPVLVVDLDPKVIEMAADRGFEVLLADLADPESFQLMNLSKAKLVISTVDDIKDNEMLLTEVKASGSKAGVIIDAESHEDALRLYELGADYVIFPHYVGSIHLGQVIKKVLGSSGGNFEEWRSSQKSAMEKVFAR